MRRYPVPVSSADTEIRERAASAWTGEKRAGFFVRFFGRV